MAGTWESQNKELPGVYLNIKTNTPLSITPGDRGTVVILQELSTGDDHTMYTITATDAAYPENATDADKKLTIEALKNAQTVILYKLPENHTADDVQTALENLESVDFNALSYPYDDQTEEKAYETAKTNITNWISAMYDDEGVAMQAVLANIDADSDRVINVVQGVLLSDGTELSAAELTAWVAGATAGASMRTSNTGKKYVGAVDVVPRMKSSAMTEASKAGKFLLKVDKSQNVTIVYDINSYTSFTVEKGKMFRKNRIIRTLDNIKNDLGVIYEGNYVGKYDNNDNGHILLKNMYVAYLKEVQRLNAIKNFEPDDITIVEGIDSDAVAVEVAAQPVDSIEKIYVTVNLS
jgi:hypothetical protein